MAYKKYIVKNGKTYGPYTYHSKRIDGKVVSEYHGKGNNVGKVSSVKTSGRFLSSGSSSGFSGIAKVQSGKGKRDFVFALIGIFLILTVLGFGSFFINKSISGNAVLNLETTYYSNESLNGVMSLSLKEGELVPKSSKVLIQTQSNTYEYNLSDLVDDSLVSEGNYYIEGESISGSGEGYGVAGKKDDEVSFVLEITNSDNTKDEVNEENNSQNEVNNEESDSVEEGSNENVSDSNTGDEIPSEENVSDSENSNVGEETPSEEVAVEENVEETSSEDQAGEEIPSEDLVVQDNSNVGESSDSSSDSSESKSESSGDSESADGSEVSTETSPITGNAVSRLFGFVANLFLNLSPTGNVVSELNQEVSGVTSSGDSYSYKLEKGQKASLKSGSVKVNGESVSDGNVSLKTSNDLVVVESNYNSDSEGYGENYIGDNVGNLTINLEDLDIPAEQGDLRISVVYEDEEILSVGTVLNVEGETILLSNGTEIPRTSLNIELTENEKTFLEKEFENLTIKTTKAEVVNGRLVVKYELGKYWIENSYEEDDSNIEALMTRDRNKWLKDLVVQLSKNETEVRKVDDLLGKEFNLTEIDSVNVTLNTSINEIVNETEEVVGDAITHRLRETGEDEEVVEENNSQNEVNNEESDSVEEGSNEVPVSSNESITEVPSEENVSDSENSNVGEETPSEEVAVEENVEETPSEEVTGDDQVEETPSDESIEEIPSEDSVVQEDNSNVGEETPIETSPITGNAISNAGSSVKNLLYDTVNSIRGFFTKIFS